MDTDERNKAMRQRTPSIRENRDQAKDEEMKEDGRRTSVRVYTR